MKSQLQVKTKKAPHVPSGEGTKEPYALVLIDAHNCRFQEDLLAKGASGGAEAAKMLKEAVQKNVTQLLGDAASYRIVARVFADLKILSADEPYEFTAFATEFSSEEPSFDFVGVKGEDVIGSKMADAVKTAVQDAECQLVIIGTSCDAGYMATLRKRLQSLGKICILQGTVSVNDLPGANKHRTVFSPVFRTISEASQPSKKEEFEEGLTIRQQYGNLYAYPRSLARPAETSALTKPHTPRDDLPRIGIDGMVPLNAAGQRLDLVTPRTIKKDWKPFLRLNSIHALCRDHHILGQCSKPDCPYDHAVIDASQLACVKTLAKRTPCTKGLFCRRVNCYKGHVCQCADCYYTGTRHKTCIMPKKMHAVDCKVDSWITLPESAGEPGLTVRHNSSTCDTASTGYRTANDGTFASEGSVSTEQSHATTDNNNSGFAANASTTSAGSLSTWNTLRAQNGSVSTLSSWMPSMTLSQWHRSLSGLHDNSSVPGSGFGGDGEPEAEVYRAKQSGEPKAAAEVSEDLDYDLIDLSG